MTLLEYLDTDKGDLCIVIVRDGQVPDAYAVYSPDGWLILDALDGEPLDLSARERADVIAFAELCKKTLQTSEESGGEFYA